MLGSIKNQTTAEGGGILTILQESAIDSLPATELIAMAEAFLAPVLTQLPEKRLGEWVAGWASLQTAMAHTPLWRASVPSFLPLLRWPSLHSTLFPSAAGGT
jgi:hypothetical protein